MWHFHTPLWLFANCYSTVLQYICYNTFIAILLLQHFCYSIVIHQKDTRGTHTSVCLSINCYSTYAISITGIVPQTLERHKGIHTGVWMLVWLLRMSHGLIHGRVHAYDDFWSCIFAKKTQKRPFYKQKVQNTQNTLLHTPKNTKHYKNESSLVLHKSC